MNNGNNTICLHKQTECTYTQVSNTFIDEYMPDANGTYVKVYLTLLRHLGNHHFNISITGIADALDLTETDVTRALGYWEKKELLSLSRDVNNTIKDITFNTPVSSAACPAPDITASGKDIPDKAYMDSAARTAGEFNMDKHDNTDRPNTADHTGQVKQYTTSELNRITSRDEFVWIINIIEKYMQRNLTPTDVELVVYLYDSLNFSSELIFYLYENCISRGKKNSKYIQAVAINWAKAGVDSVEKANEYLAAFDSRYMEVMKALGLLQAPAPAQKQYIDSWLSAGFEPEVIKEACNRTTIAVGGANFKYANGILEKWKAQGVKTLEDIKVTDDLHAKAVINSKAAAKPKSNSFNSYEQRDYSANDYSALERQLLNH